MSKTNLPERTLDDSAAGTRLFFDSYGRDPIEFSAVDVNSCQIFFEEKGFEKDTALTISAALLKQAKIDGTPIFQILDSLKTFDKIQLNVLVGEILNNNRVPTSSLGFKTTPVFTDQTRKISA